MTQDETDHGPFRCNREGGVPTLLEGKNFKLMTGIISQGSTEGESKQATPTPFQKPVKERMKHQGEIQPQQEHPKGNPE